MLRLQGTQRRCGEMADATDLKSVGLLTARAGSSPAIGTSNRGKRIAESEDTHDHLDLVGFGFLNPLNLVNPVN
jgi:hypothetical protein